MKESIASTVAGDQSFSGRRCTNECSAVTVFVRRPCRVTGNSRCRLFEAKTEGQGEREQLTIIGESQLLPQNLEHEFLRV